MRKTGPINAFVKFSIPPCILKISETFCWPNSAIIQLRPRVSGVCRGAGEKPLFLLQWRCGSVFSLVVSRLVKDQKLCDLYNIQLPVLLLDSYYSFRLAALWGHLYSQTWTAAWNVRYELKVSDRTWARFQAVIGIWKYLYFAPTTIGRLRFGF